MKTGTKYCPNHPGAKHLEYANECSQCNEALLRFGAVVETLSAPIVEREIVLRRLNEPEPEKVSFKELHEKITMKIKEKVETKKAAPAHAKAKKGE